MSRKNMRAIQEQYDRRNITGRNKPLIEAVQAAKLNRELRAARERIELAHLRVKDIRPHGSIELTVVNAWEFPKGQVFLVGDAWFVVDDVTPSPEADDTHRVILVPAPVPTHVAQSIHLATRQPE